MELHDFGTIIDFDGISLGLSEPSPAIFVVITILFLIISLSFLSSGLVTLLASALIFFDRDFFGFVSILLFDTLGWTAAIVDAGAFIFGMCWRCCI